MRIIDSGELAAVDIIDGGDTASPPTDIVMSAHLLEAQPVTGVLDPEFVSVDTLDVIDPGDGLMVLVRVGGTSTDVTVEVPGVQPYSGVARADRTVAGLQNTDLLVHLPDLLFDPLSEVASVTYSQTTGVTAVLLQGT